MLQIVHDQLPELYRFVYLCYSKSSHLRFGDTVLTSDERAQQGDHLGPMLYCMATLQLTHSVTSEMNMWYLDDVDNLYNYFLTIKRAGEQVGLQLNEAKSLQMTWLCVTEYATLRRAERLSKECKMLPSFYWCICELNYCSFLFLLILSF